MSPLYDFGMGLASLSQMNKPGMRESVLLPSAFEGIFVCCGVIRNLRLDAHER